MIVGGLSIVATVALFIGSAIIVTLGVIGGVHLLNKLERFYLGRRAIHERTRIPEPCAWSERDFGDQPNVDVFHNGTNTRKGQ